MQNKKVIILIVLSIFAVISLIHGIIAGPKTRRAVRPYTIVTSGGVLQSTQPQAAVSMQRRAKRSKFSSWKRNPFVPSGLPASSGFILNGIMWNKTNPTAMVGDTIVKKGDKISGNTVVEIREDRVIMNDGAKDFELRLKE